MFYLSALKTIGVLAGLSSFYRPAIFCLHSVVAESGPDTFASEMSVTDVFLDRLITDLRRRQVPILALSEALQRLDEGDFRPFVCFTFDDGYRDNYDRAFPVFQRHNAPFAVFVTTGLVDQQVPMWWHVLERLVSDANHIAWSGERMPTATPGQKQVAFRRVRDAFIACDFDGHRDLLRQFEELNPIDGNLAYTSALTWGMIREMKSSGLVEFGCHSVTHPLLSHLPRRRLEAEIDGSMTRLWRETGTKPCLFAYPYGQDHEVGEAAPGIVREAGFQAAFTTRARVLRRTAMTSRFRLPRIMLTRRAQRLSIVRSYMSGVVGSLKQISGRG